MTLVGHWVTLVELFSSVSHIGRLAGLGCCDSVQRVRGELVIRCVILRLFQHRSTRLMVAVVAGAGLLLLLQLELLRGHVLIVRLNQHVVHSLEGILGLVLGRRLMIDEILR